MTSRSAAAALALSAALGCSQGGEKPPPPACASCGLVSPGRVGHVGPPDGGTSGTGGADGGDDEPVRVSGDVQVLDSIASLAASRWVEPADLLMEGGDGDVIGRWNGIDPFSVDGVKRAPVVWTQVTPGPGDALRTLQPLDTRLPNSAGIVPTSLAVVRASELDLAFGVLALPLSRDQTRAQAVVVALNGGRPAAGVSVLAPAAEAVIYVDNGGFSDTAAATDGSGIFLLANLAAASWPGSGVTITLSGPVSGRWDLRIVSGGVTFGAIGD